MNSIVNGGNIKQILNSIIHFSEKAGRENSQDDRLMAHNMADEVINLMTGDVIPFDETDEYEKYCHPTPIPPTLKDDRDDIARELRKEVSDLLLNMFEIKLIRNRHTPSIGHSYSLLFVPGFLPEELKNGYNVEIAQINGEKPKKLSWGNFIYQTRIDSDIFHRQDIIPYVARHYAEQAIYVLFETLNLKSIMSLFSDDNFRKLYEKCWHHRWRGEELL